MSAGATANEEALKGDMTYPAVNEHADLGILEQRRRQNGVSARSDVEGYGTEDEGGEAAASAISPGALRHRAGESELRCAEWRETELT